MKMLLCPAPCMTFVEAGNDWHEAMLDHVLQAGRDHPQVVHVIEVESRFWALVRPLQRKHRTHRR